MGTTCQIAGCKNDSPSALAEQKMCVLHFTLALETSCGEMRRETALGNAPQERQREIMRFITEHGVASIPCSAFLYKDPGGPVLRFCFAKKDETLHAAAERLRRI